LLLFGVPLLALVGALAVACFVKVYGVVFLGEPRCHQDPDPRESPVSMRLPMAVLSIGCILIGTMPFLVTGALDRAVTAWQLGPNLARLSSLVPFSTLLRVNCALLAVSLAVAFILKQLTPRARTARALTWDCGYSAPSARMQYTASSFADGLVALFSMFLRPRAATPTLTEPFPPKSYFESHVPEVVLDLVVLPALRGLARAAYWFRRIQAGRIHIYIIYILVALVAMLVVWH
jgi:hydrogenase-4 component B